MAYVTDLAGTPSNLNRAAELARAADVLFCEAAFLDRDADHARRKHHRTARQAGELARQAGAGRLEVFHFSPKYLDEEQALLDEARSAHLGPLSLTAPEG